MTRVNQSSQRQAFAVHRYPKHSNDMVHISTSCIFQVNAGPMAYAETFLSEEKVSRYPAERVESLKNVFRSVLLCNRGKKKRQECVQIFRVNTVYPKYLDKFMPE